jgi:hypothetical protein
MLRLTFNSVRVDRRRLSETAVAPSARSIENATISEYDGSLPTTVMSVPCIVVTTFGTGLCPLASRTCLARSAAAACGIA